MLSLLEIKRDLKIEFLDSLYERIFDTSNAQTMLCMFKGCEATVLDLRGFDTSKADVTGMLLYCFALVLYEDTNEKIVTEIRKVH